MVRAGDVLARRYRLLERVAGGGMGDVWRGEDTVLGRTIAVKVLLSKLSDSRGFRERFRREARAIAALQGEGIVDVYDYGEEEFIDGTVAFLIMQYVDGVPLTRRIAAAGRLGAAETLAVVSQVASALDIAHQSGIIHRDVKPGNILVREDGRVVLVDFGIARTETDHTMTRTGVVLGTVTYMSPEQASGEKLTLASDIYSLGVVAHQCLTGQPPFHADTPLEVLSAHLRNEPPQLPVDIPEPIPTLISRALAKSPSQRWATAGQFARACRTAAKRYPDEVSQPATTDATAVPLVRQSRPSAVVAAAAVPATGALPHAGQVTTPPRPTPPAAQAPKPKAHPKAVKALFATALVIALASVTLVAVQPWDPVTTARGDAAGNAADAMDPSDAGRAAPEDVERPDEDKPAHNDKSETSDGDSTSHLAPTSGASSSHGPETVEVPDVIRRTEPQAKSAIGEAGLRTDVVYEGEGDVCDVMAQNPDAGQHVESGSTVTITVRKASGGCPRLQLLT